MTAIREGSNVRIVTPDDPDHEFGYVAQITEGHGDRDAWEVWVTHTCDCWKIGQTADHTRGYTRREVTSA